MWWSYNIIGRVPIFLAGVWVKVKGKENIERKKSYVLVSNHQSYLDAIVNGSSFPGVFKFLAKAELSKPPVFGYLIKRICILTDRSNKASRIKSFQSMVNALKEGYSIMIYPEGTRNLTDRPLLKFYDGAFKLAIDSGTPILVQTLINSGNLLQSHKAKMRPGFIIAVWEAPISTEGMTKDDIPELKEKVRVIMLEKLKTYNASQSIEAPG